MNFSHGLMFAAYLIIVNGLTVLAMTAYYWKRLDNPVDIVLAITKWSVLGLVACTSLLFYLSVDHSFSWSDFSLAGIIYGGAVVAGLSDARTEAV